MEPITIGTQRLVAKGYELSKRISHLPPHTGMAFDLFRYARHGDAAFFVPDHVGGSPEVLRVDIGPLSILTANPVALAKPRCFDREFTACNEVAMLDGVILLWFVLTAIALLFVAIDIRTTPESPVLKWGFVLVTAYTGASPGDEHQPRFPGGVAIGLLTSF
jgi:hypothetical protein